MISYAILTMYLILLFYSGVLALIVIDAYQERRWSILTEQTPLMPSVSHPYTYDEVIRGGAKLHNSAVFVD